MLRQVLLLSKCGHAHQAAAHRATQPCRVNQLPSAAGTAGAAAAFRAAAGAAVPMGAAASAGRRCLLTLDVEALPGCKAGHLGEQVGQLCRIHLAAVVAAQKNHSCTRDE